MTRLEEKQLWSAGLSVLRHLSDCGYAAYFTGGCVRDRAMGRPLHDIDIATSALPEEVARIFERTIPTGIKHGTVTVLHQGFAFEVTTFRTESGYSDARRPDSVAFVKDIETDLARRDFTINAMAIGLDGEYVDPYGGLADLKKRVIRCVGEAEERFGEDALRMLRAIRFASVFEFRLVKSVWRGIRRQAPRLRQVAMERVGSEWDRMMAGPHPDRACALLLRSGLLAHLKEPLPDSVNKCRSRTDGGMEQLLLDKMAEPDVRWAASLSRTEVSPEEGQLLCQTLRFSKARQLRIKSAVAFARRMENEIDHQEAFIDVVLDLGKQAAEDWLATLPDPVQHRSWMRQMNVYTVGDLAIKGDELTRALDKPPGPWIAPLLRRLLADAASGRIANTRDELLRAAARYERDREV